MKRLIASLIAVMLSTSTGAIGQEAAERPWSLDVTTSFYSDYMFRGFNLYDGVSVQPSVAGTYTFGDFGTVGGSVWAHLSSEGDRKQESFTEVDYTLTHTITFDPISFTIGHAWYTYPRDQYGLSVPSNELFLVVGLDAFLSPSLSIYQDYREFDTQYYEISLSHEAALPFLGEGALATPFMSVGFASNGEKIYEDDGLVQLTTGVAFDAKVGELNLQPSLNYTYGVDDNTVNEFWIGTKLSYSF